MRIKRRNIMVKTRKKLLVVLGVISLVLLSTFLLVGCNEEPSTQEPILSLKTSFQTEYEIGEELNISGGQLLYTDENGKETTVDIEISFVTGFDSATAGKKKLTINYLDKSIEVDYVVYPEFMEINTYYQAVSLLDNSYNYLKLISEETFEFTSNYIPTFESGTKREFTIVSKIIQAGKWFVVAESDNSKLEITINSPLSLTANIYADDEIVDTYTFTKLLVPEFVEENSYYEARSSLDESYNYIKFISEDTIEFTSNSTPGFENGYVIQFSIYSKTIQDGKWFVVAERQENSTRLELTINNSSSFTAELYANSEIIDTYRFTKMA